MEFCGGHTHAILRYGIRQLLSPTVEMLSGPGCPVCVTANADLDKAIALSQLPGVILSSFGDMIRVPGSYSSLQRAKAEGADIRIVYSAMDAIDIAKGNPQKSVIFLGIGFETTAPTIAASILEAKQQGIDNYYVFPIHKLCPPAIKAILDCGEVELDGIIGPGHVSAIIGSRPYEFIAQEYGIACVISGFEMLDMLLSIEMLIAQIESGRPRVEIAYRRGVRPEGNQRALEIMDRVFEICPATWRGIGEIPQSGLRLKQEYRHFDAKQAFPVFTNPPREPKGCLCGDILRGVKIPPDCKLFRRICTPEHPVGPCMVSSEGSCAAYYQYQSLNE
jgi:hydrogenase expression/formation protein HypD